MFFNSINFDRFKISWLLINLKHRFDSSRLFNYFILLIKFDQFEFGYCFNSSILNISNFKIMIFGEILKLKILGFKQVLHAKLHVELLHHLNQFSFLKVLLKSRLKCIIHFNQKQTHLWQRYLHETQLENCLKFRFLQQ